MIILEALGVASVRVGGLAVVPTATRLFGALLFLAEERGREIPRVELQELIYPDRPEPAGRHSLRQLLYRIRRMGTPLETNGDAIHLAEETVETDYESLGSAGQLTPEVCRAITNGILPGFAPAYSRRLGSWLEERRSAIQHVVVQQLVSALAKSRAAGDWSELETVARTAIAIDPLNEEATLALSESLALTGQKAGAIQLLNAYIRDVTPYSTDIQLPAKVLRTRISEQPHLRGHRRLGSGPFVGRRREMADLWQHYVFASRNEPRAFVIFGVPGIGKTRLAKEFLTAAELDGATCISVDCAPHYIKRPLGVFIDLIPQLLAAPGGLGVAPEALEHLRRLTNTQQPAPSEASDQGSNHVFSRILASIRDLLDAVAMERPLVVLVDDAQCIDEASLHAILEYTGKPSSIPLLFLLASRTRVFETGTAPTADRVFWQRINPLAGAASRSLYTTLISDTTPRLPIIDPDAVVSMAAGNPLYIRCLASESNVRDPRELPQSLARLLQQRIQRLSDISLRAFVAAILLGKHCRLDRLVRIAGLTERELLSAIQVLETDGYLITNGVDIRSAHPLLSEAAMAEFPPVTQRLMRSAIAGLLEGEAAPAQEVALLWDAAEHWHGAGATDRAVALLESCAQHCLAIGRPRVACEVLERASALCSEDQLERILNSLIRAARSAEDFDLMLRSIRQQRSEILHAGDATIHDDLEMLAIQAERHLGTPLPTLVPRLRVCVLDGTASSAHRLSVAPTLLAAYELLLDGPAAESAHSAIMNIPSESTDDSLYKLRADLQYHTFAGSNVKAIRAGRTLLAQLKSIPSELHRTRLIADAGLALFRCGDCAAGLEAMHEAYSLAHDRGMAPSLLDTASMLAWMYYAIGDFTNMRRFDAMSDALHDARPNSTSRIAHYLSNKIEFALFSGDGAGAVIWLNRAAEEYSEIETPRSRLLARSFELRAGQLNGTASADRRTLNELAKDHALGMRWGLHDNFVEAYWMALNQAGARATANTILREYIVTYRRDGFPLLPRLAQIATASGAPQTVDS